MTNDEKMKLRERVLKLSKEGLSYKLIADRLGISDRSVARTVQKYGPKLKKA